MKNRNILHFLVLILLISLLLAGGCGVIPVGTDGKEKENLEDNRLRISTSFYPMYIMTLNIIEGVPGVELVNIAPPQTGCLHDYQLTTNDLKNMEKTQVLVVNGAGMENYLDRVIRQLPDLKIIEASKGLSFIKGSGHDHDEEINQMEHDDHEGEVNAHIWVSISGAIGEVKNIRDQLAELDPAYAESYRTNADKYISKLEELRSRMHQTLDGIENRKIITFHEAFPYFAQEFDLDIAAVIQREPGSEPSPKEIAASIELIREHGIKAIFAEPQYSPLAAEAIARETTAKVYTLDPAVTGEMEPDAYLKAMEANLLTLTEALAE